MSKAPQQVGTSTNNTTTTQLPPEYVQSAQQGLLGAGANLTIPFAQNPPPTMVAPLNANQQIGLDYSSMYAQQANHAPREVSDFGDYTAKAAQLKPSDIEQFFNPYQKDVVDTTTQQLSEANDKSLAAIRARQGAEGAYGGNRGALEEMEQNRNYGNTLAATVAGLNNTGWQNAVTPAMQNAGWKQQTNIFNAQQPLAAAQIQNQLDAQNYQQKMGTVQNLLGAGGMEQAQAQKYYDQPFKALGIFDSIVPGNYGSVGSGTSSQPIYAPSTFQTAMGIGGMAAGALSDRTTKTDIKKLGVDEETGLTHYTYNYKDDPKGSPKRVGPMAQDVEKKYPGSTKRIGGKMVIKGGARALLGL